MKIINHILRANKPHSSKAARFIVIFYLIGLVGFLVPWSRDLFIQLTGWALLLNFFLLIWFHHERLTARTITIFSLIFLLGYLVEVAGVNTGVIFGQYSYGKGLGLKVFDTPVLIGMNWLMLTYCFAAVMQSVQIHSILRALIAASGMVLYDLVMEQAAPLLDLWTFPEGIIPFENFLAWFVIALIFQGILISFRVRFKNPLALIMIICQFVFFLVIATYKYFAV